MEPFLKNGLAFAILQLLGNEFGLIERLQSWEIGLAKISTPSFRNLPDKLSMPAALDAFKPYKIFNISLEDVSENSEKVRKVLKLNFIIVGCDFRLSKDIW